MSQEFDPYLQWLGISKKEPRPINFYRLLGVDKFETNADVIAMNGDKQIEHLRKFSSGPQGELAEKMINDLIKAKLTLLKADRKAAYDQHLRVAAQPVARPVPVQPVPNYAAPTAAPASDPAQWNIEGLTAPANAAPVRLASAAFVQPTAYAQPAAPVQGMDFSPFGNSSVRAPVATAASAAKPTKSIMPWVFVGLGVAACVALTMVLASRNPDDKPVAAKDPSEKTAPTETPAKKNPDAKKPPAVAVPVKTVTPTPEPTPEVETPAVTTPTPTPTPVEPAKPPKVTPTKKPPAAKKVNFDWPPVTDPSEQQVVTQNGFTNKTYKAYRYPGINPRMATIVTRGHTASRWRIDQDQLTLSSGGSAAEYLLFGDPKWTDYTVEYEVYADATNMITPAGLLFRCDDDEHFQMFQNSHASGKSLLQAWSFDQEGFRNLEDLNGEPIEPVIDTYLSPKQWRKYSVTVAGDRVVAKRDAAQLFDKEVKQPANGRVGLKFHAYADTTVRVRNIRVTAPDGKVLWEGVPELPPSLAKAETVLWPLEDFKPFAFYPKREKPGRWNIDRGLLTAQGNDNPPLLLTQDSTFENFYLQIKFRKLEGGVDVCLRTSDGLKPLDEQRGLRLHMTDATKPGTPDNQRKMYLEVAVASDGMQLRLNGVTKMQKLFATGGESLRGSVGLDLIKPGSEVQIEEILVRKLPDNFRIFETRNGPLLDERGESPAVAMNNPPANNNPPPKNPANNNPNLNPNPGLNGNPVPAMNPGLNPDLQPRNSELGELAKKDEDVKKFLDELTKARELCTTKIKKFEEDYLKAFDLEISRVRTTTTLNASDRADLMQTLTQDKKDFETKKRFSLAHGMMPKNNIIGLIFLERQRLERLYNLMTDRMLKEKRDEVVLAIKKAREEDPDLRPLKVFSVLYYHYPNSQPVQYDFMGDKTVNTEKRELNNFNNNNNDKTMVNNPQITWAIDGEKRLNFAGPLMYERMSQEQIQITLDGRKLVNGKSSTTSSIKSGTIVVD
jgi:hypothetical protein